MRNRNVNIFTAFKPHTADTYEFLPRLDRALSKFNLSYPTCVVGDLYNDMLTGIGNELRSSLMCHNPTQLVKNPTHFQRGAETLLDVVFTNSPNLVRHLSVIRARKNILHKLDLVLF